MDVLAVAGANREFIAQIIVSLDKGIISGTSIMLLTKPAIS